MMCLILVSGIRAMRFRAQRSGSGTLRSFRNFICSLDGTECAVKKRRLEREREGTRGRIDFPGFVCQEGRNKRDGYSLTLGTLEDSLYSILALGDLPSIKVEWRVVI